MMAILNVVHFVVVTMALVAVVAHMNAMTPKRTPKIEMIGWWFFGVGMAGEVVWALHGFYVGDPYDPTDEHFLLSIGAAVLAVVYAQPEWRPYIADRRKNKEDPLPPDCDRRCQHLMGSREEKHRRIPIVPS